jgi:hypothetical protein
MPLRLGQQVIRQAWKKKDWEESHEKSQSPKSDHPGHNQETGADQKNPQPPHWREKQNGG